MMDDPDMDKDPVMDAEEFVERYERLFPEKAREENSWLNEATYHLKMLMNYIEENI